MASNTDHGQSFGFGGKPSASSSVSNKFDIPLNLDGNETWSEQSEGDSKDEVPAVSNPNQGEKQNMTLATGSNKFPRQGGHDSLSEEEAQLA